jgi:methenyltetrahydrofolate cyclohydrolase
VTEPAPATETQTVRYRDLTLDRFVERLASADPVPGGGSASAVGAALGSALVAMVAELSTGRPRYEQHTELIGRVRIEARDLSDRFLRLADEDAVAYAAFSAAARLPRETDAEKATRSEAMKAAARRASEVPLACVEASARLIVLAESLAGRSNVNASSDLGVAALFAEAAARGAAANVLVNLPSVGDEPFAADMRLRLDALLRDVERGARAVRELISTGAAREPLVDPR